MNTELFKQMLAIKREKEISIRELAKICDVSHGTLIKFFDEDKPFTVFSNITMAKIHNHLGISYDVLEDYNKQVKEGNV